MTNPLAIAAPTSVVRFPFDMATLEAKRGNLVLGINTRIEYETKNAPDTDKGQRDLISIVSYLGRQRDNARKIDAATLCFAEHIGMCFVNELNNKRVEGALCNVYAFPKMLACMAVLNGGSFRHDSDGRTIAATVLAMHAKHAGGKRMWDAINAQCSAWGMGGGNYGSAATQGGSSLRAMAALGIVTKEGMGHAVASAEHFKTLLTAARKLLK